MKRPDILKHAVSFTVGDGDREQAERLESCICGIIEGLWSHASNEIVALEMTLAYSVTLLDMLARKGDRAKVLLARDFLMKHIHAQSRRRMNGRLIKTMTGQGCRPCCLRNTSRSSIAASELVEA